MTASFLFSTIDVTRQVFYRTSLTYAIVNLKPIVPGHVLVCPRRVVPRLSDLNHNELGDLMTAVQAVGEVIERVHRADALTIACQDGRAAGQSIPHVHFHILPRKLRGDFFERNDDVYPAIEHFEGTIPSPNEQAHPEPFKVDADENRRPRSMEEMEQEAISLAEHFAANSPFQK